MSRSSSTGDLVPKDITETLALQNKISKSRKKRGSSLSRTFSWFKGSKPKKVVSNGHNRSGRLGDWTGECTTIRRDSDNHDALKVMGTSLQGGDLYSNGGGGGVKRDRSIITLEKHTAECLMKSSDSDIDAHSTSPKTNM